MSILLSLLESEKDYLIERQNYNPMFDKVMKAYDQEVELVLNSSDDFTDEAKTTIIQKTSLDRTSMLEEWQSFVKRSSRLTRNNDRTTWLIKRLRLSIASHYYRLFYNRLRKVVPDNISPEDSPMYKVLWEFRQSLAKDNEFNDKSYFSGLFGVDIPNEFGEPFRNTYEYVADYFFDRLIHYNGIQYRPIQRLPFAGKSTELVLKQLQNLEEQYLQKKKVNSRYVNENDIEDDVELLIDFNDGYGWYDLNTSVSREEADMMGHCCTDPRTEYDGTVYSLRQRIKKKGTWYLKSVATFMMKEKVVYEMKGFGNEKPVSKYHPYIIKLLESDLVTKIAGGGYMAENNFSVLDLKEPEYTRLLKKKPLLATLTEAAKYFGTDSEIFLERIKSDAPWKYDEHNKIFLVEKFKSFMELAKHHGSDHIKWMIKIFEGDEFFEVFYDATPDTSDVVEWVSHDQSVKDDILKLANKKYKDEITENDLDPNNIDEVIEFFMEYDQDEIFKNATITATEDGLRIGGESEMWKTFENGIAGKEILGLNDEITDEVFNVGYYESDEKEENPVMIYEFKWDTECWVSIDIENAAKLITKYMDDDTDDSLIVSGERIDISEPYNGYSDYDDDAARDHFLERWDEDFQ